MKLKSLIIAFVALTPMVWLYASKVTHDTNHISKNLTGDKTKKYFFSFKNTKDTPVYITLDGNQGSEFSSDDISNNPCNNLGDWPSMWRVKIEPNEYCNINVLAVDHSARGGKGNINIKYTDDGWLRNNGIIFYSEFSGNAQLKFKTGKHPYPSINYIATYLSHIDWKSCSSAHDEPQNDCNIRSGKDSKLVFDLR